MARTAQEVSFRNRLIVSEKVSANTEGLASHEAKDKTLVGDYEGFSLLANPMAAIFPHTLKNNVALGGHEKMAGGIWLTKGIASTFVII